MPRKLVAVPSEIKAAGLPDTVTAPRTDPIYNCHGYLTKVPVGAIEPFINTFTKPGEVVADFFAGSGMTGLAAVRHGRKARLSDISVLGRHIAEGYLTEVAQDRFSQEAERVAAEARKEVGDFYTAKRSDDGATVEMVRTVWSFVYACPKCHHEIVYFEHLSPQGAPPKSCPHCRGPFARRNWPRGDDIPVEVVVRDRSGKLVSQPPSPYDKRLIGEAITDRRQAEVPSLVIDKDREMFGRSGLGKTGLTATGKFFSPRNAIALVELWKAIGVVNDAAIRKKLQFCFTAILPRASRRYQWSAQRPLNAQNQTYYIAPVYYEWNVFELFARKVEAAIRSDRELAGDLPLLSLGKKDASYKLASADNVFHLADESVDYVFTDPPFGSNIFYSDMNLFHEAWLGETTDHASEAVVHTSGRRKNGAAERYERLLAGAFAEAYRVLKPGKYMSVVFGNSNGRIWGLVQRAIRDAGFKSTPAHVAILDKGQRSVKGLNSGTESVVTVDLVLTVQKPAHSEAANDARAPSSGDTRRLIEDTVQSLTPDELSNPSHVYARILRAAIQKHQILDDLHLGDVLLALRNAGYEINAKSGRLIVQPDTSVRDQRRRKVAASA